MTDEKTLKLGWLSDVHLNFLNDEGRSLFFESLKNYRVQGWLLAGDIGEAKSIVGYLEEFQKMLEVPTYFVLGNHDFYLGSLAQVRADVSAMVATNKRLIWLTESDPIRLSTEVMLVGDDCWSDGRLGNPLSTPVELNDFHLIKELAGHSRAELVDYLNRLGDEGATRLKGKLAKAAATGSRVVVVLHPPPFTGAAWHEGRNSSPDWLPWFACKAAGDSISSVAATFPDTRFTIFCGHTHSCGVYSPQPNVTVHTAQAEYGQPRVQGVLISAIDF